MRINTNMSALVANRQLQKSDKNMSSSMEKLSSGYRINQSADDVAGMAIATKLRTQIKALERSGNNASDGVSIVQSAEGALNEVHTMLQRMRELAVQGANDTNSPEDREAIQDEIEQLTTEIERIRKDTQYNNKNLLDGSQDRRSYTSASVGGAAVSGTEVLYVTGQVPSNNYSIYVSGLAEKAEYDNIDLAGIFNGNNVKADAEGTLSFNGYDVSIKEGQTKSEVMANIRVAAQKMGAEVVAGTSDTEFSLCSEDYGSKTKLTISASNTELASAFNIPAGRESRTVQGKDMEASLTSGGVREGFENSAVINCDGMYATIIDNGGFEMRVKVNPQEVGNLGGDTLKVNAEVTDIGTLTLHIGANAWQTMEVRIPRIDLEVMGIDNLNYLTRNGCNFAMPAIDGAISYISSARSLLGACQNRLDAAISSLSTTSENMTEAFSRIMDTDMSKEMTEYTKYNVLAQAGTSMVAQANERPQMLLQLLQ